MNEKEEGTNDSIEKSSFESSWPKRRKKKEGKKARCTDIVVPDTFPVISRSIVYATQVERYKNSTYARRDVNALHSVRIEYVK